MCAWRRRRWEWGLHLAGLNLRQEHFLKSISRPSDQQHLNAVSPFNHHDSVVDQYLSCPLGTNGETELWEKKYVILIGWNSVPCPQAEASRSPLPWPG